MAMSIDHEQEQLRLAIATHVAWARHVLSPSPRDFEATDKILGAIAALSQQQPSVQEGALEALRHGCQERGLDVKGDGDWLQMVGTVLAVVDNNKFLRERLVELTQYSDPPAGQHGRMIGPMFDPSDWPAERKRRESEPSVQVTDELVKAAERARDELHRQAVAWITVAPILEAHVYEQRSDGHVWNAYTRWNRGSQAHASAAALVAALSSESKS